MRECYQGTAMSTKFRLFLCCHWMLMFIVTIDVIVTTQVYLLSIMCVIYVDVTCDKLSRPDVILGAFGC